MGSTQMATQHEAARAALNYRTDQESDLPTVDDVLDEHDDSTFWLRYRSYASADDGVELEADKAHNNRVDARDAFGDAWSKIASQQQNGVDVSDKDDAELVYIGIYGWWVNDDDTWSNPFNGYGNIYGNGREYTYAVLEHDDENSHGFAGSEKAFKFSRVYNTDNSWSDVGDFWAPMSGIDLVTGEGEPSAVDRQRSRSTDYYPEDENGDRDFTGRVSEDDFVASVAERVLDDRIDESTTINFETFDALEEEFGETAKDAANVGLGHYLKVHRAEYDGYPENREMNAAISGIANAVAETFMGDE